MKGKSYAKIQRARRLRLSQGHVHRQGYVPPAHFHTKAGKAIAKQVRLAGGLRKRPTAYYRKVEGLPDKEVLAKRVSHHFRQALEAHGWSLNRVATMIGADYAHIWRIMNGHHSCTLEMALKICWALDIRLDDFARPLPAEKTTREGLPNSDPGRIPGTESSDRWDILDHPDRRL